MFEARVAELEALAQQQGLDFFPTSFEIVPHDIMTEIAAYGLPTRARHWSYRKVAWQMKQKMAERYPFLGGQIKATPPDEEDSLIR